MIFREEQSNVLAWDGSLVEANPGTTIDVPKDLFCHIFDRDHASHEKFGVPKPRQLGPRFTRHRYDSLTPVT
jgi:hypothetical protein